MRVYRETRNETERRIEAAQAKGEEEPTEAANLNTNLEKVLRDREEESGETGGERERKKGREAKLGPHLAPTLPGG